MLEITMIGHLGQEPEMRFTPANQAVTNISVASSRKFTAADGSKKEETTWVRATAWGKTAEAVASYLHKGSLVYIKARLKPEITVFDRKDGTKAASYEVTIETIEFLSSNGNRTPVEEGAPVDSADIPF